MRTLACSLAIMTLVLVPSTTQAQAARSAAARNAPPPPMADMFEHVPAHMSAMLVGDIEALAEAIDSSLSFGFGDAGLARHGFNMIARRTNWYEDGVQLDLSRRLVLAFHEPTDHAILVMDSAAVQVPTISAGNPVRLGFDAHLHQLDAAFAVTTQDGPWQAPATSFDLAAVWPDAAPYVEDSVGWAYLSEPEIVRELDREFSHRFSSAGISRALIVLGSDNSFTAIADTTQESAEDLMGLIQASASASTASGLPQPLVALHVESAMSEITFTTLPGGAVAVHLPSPQCGGLMQQFFGALGVGALWYSAEQHGRGVAQPWSSNSPGRAPSCELSTEGDALPWDALRLIPNNEQPGFAVLTDLRRLASDLSRSASGLSPYVLTEDAFIEAVEESEYGEFVLAEQPFAFVMTEDSAGVHTAFVASEPVASALSVQTTELAGIGPVGGDAPDALDETAPYPAHWTALRGVSPEDSAVVWVANPALLVDAVSEVPSMFHGAFTNALAESEGVLFAIDNEQRLVMRIQGIPPSSADAVDTNLVAMATDLVLVSDTLFPRGMRPVAEAFAATIEVTDFDSGVEVRLGENSAQLFILLGTFGLASAPLSMMHQPSSMPTAIP